MRLSKILVFTTILLLLLSAFAFGADLESLAKQEGKVVVYSITSRIANAAKAFEKKYGIKVEAYDLHDFELVEKVSKEVKSGITGADFIIAQDSGRVFGELLEPGYVYSYVPEDMKSVIPKEFQDPLVFSFISKVFCYNSETYQAPPVNNIWELADPKMKGKFFFKDPFKEGVNMNFLTMITSPKWAKRIADAYERYYGKPIKLTTKNAGYEWIKAVLKNGLVMFTSDTKLAESIGIRGQGVDAIGLFAYTKLRYRKSKNLALMPIMGMDPFAGFYYPAYLLMVKNAKHPNAAKLFIDFLLTPEGFKPWHKSPGVYSSNPNIPPYPVDNAFKVWKEILVGEEGEFIFNNRADVEEFWGNFAY